MSKYLCLILVAAVIAGCTSFTALAPLPTETPAPKVTGAGITLESNGVQILIMEVKEGKYSTMRVMDTQAEAEKDSLTGQYQKAKEGYRFVQTTLKMLEGAAPKDVYEWKIRLKDSNGDEYEAAIKSSGVLAGGANNLNWIFVVPEEVKAFSLVFPGNIVIDLQPLMQNK